MSHGRERTEKNCLNCGTMVEGRFCQSCGQENIEPHETFFGMVNHFFSDITHFDGKFFKTVGILATKPGFLSRQYISGKRHSFLHPIRMYVFTSALFFLVFFSLFNVKENTFGGRSGNPWADKQVRTYGNEAYKNAVTHEDSMDIKEAMEMFLPADSTDKPKKRRVRSAFDLAESKDYKTLKQYDSVQASLPAAQKDGWMKKLMIRKGLDINDRYPGEEGKLTAEILNKFLHTLPAMLFISLPLYGFFLYLLYVRRRKQFYFADHAIFLIHLYIFTFILTMLLMLLSKLDSVWVSFVIGAMLIYGVGYTLKAFRNFYGQGWLKTIFKFLLFNFLCVVSLGFLFAIFFGYAIFQV
ncbi:MAG: DUF3667 domain-containing protein [Chitinophagaceae bacterium]|nr:MAG: DUF3667 domain-containing protein [Chitinophagaceae bacterium]